MSGYMTRVIKPTKAEFSRAYVDSEKDAEKKLDETAEKMIDKSGRIGEKKRNMNKSLEDKNKYFKESFLDDFSILYRKNVGHLYPFSSLNESEKLNAKMRGFIFASSFFLLYSNYYNIILKNKKYLPVQWDWGNLRQSPLFINVILVIVILILAILFYMYHKNAYEKDLNNLKNEVDMIPTIVERTKQQIKDDFNDITFNNIILSEDGTPQYENPQREPIRVEHAQMNTHMGNLLLS